MTGSTGTSRVTSRRRFKEGDRVRLKIASSDSKEIREVVGLITDEKPHLVILDREVLGIRDSEQRHSRVWRHNDLESARA